MRSTSRLRGAERQAQRQLARPRDRLRRGQVGDVHARDQQDERGRRKQHQQRRAHRSVLPLAGGLRADGPARVRPRELLRQLAVDRGQLVARLRDRSRPARARRGLTTDSRRAARLRLGVRDERREDLRVEERHGERRREDADDGVRLAVDHERRAEHAAAAERCRASSDR